MKRANLKILSMFVAISVIVSAFVPAEPSSAAADVVISKWTFTAANYPNVPVGNTSYGSSYVGEKVETPSVKSMASSGGANVGADFLKRNHHANYPKGDFKSGDYDNTNSMKHMALKGTSSSASGWLITAGWSNDENYVYLELNTTDYDKLILKYQIRASGTSTPSLLKLQYSFDKSAWININPEVSTRGSNGSANVIISQTEHLPLSTYNKSKVYIRWFGKYGSTSGFIEFKDIELIQSDSANPGPEPETTFTHITSTIGATPAELAFSWFTPKGHKPNNAIIQYVKASELVGGKMPANPKSVTGVNKAGSPSYDTNKTRVDGLLPSTEYAYRVGDGTNWSNVYRFKTQNPDSYTAMVVADPQLDGKAANEDSWRRTMKSATGALPDYAFIMCAGDHMQQCNDTGMLDEYKSPPELTSYPVASCYGNHDHTFDKSLADQNSRYLTLMNEWPKTAQAINDGYNYYFVYGNTLYIVLDSNTKSTSSHEKFMETALKSAEDATWRVLMYHHDIFGGGSHANPKREDGSVGDAYQRQPEWSAFVSKYPIDVVFNGHDHLYVRAKLMINQTAQEIQTPVTFNQSLNEKNPGVVISPTGVQFMSLGTASDKFSYDPVAQSWHAFANKTPKKELKAQFTNLRVEGDSLSIDTYSVLGLGKHELLDSITFRKKATKQDLGTMLAGAKKAGNTTSGFTAAITAADAVLNNSFSPAEQVHNVFKSVYSAYYGKPCANPGHKCTECGLGPCGAHTCSVCQITCNAANCPICDHAKGECTLHICELCNRTCDNFPHKCAPCDRSATCGAHTCDKCGIVCTLPNCTICNPVTTTTDTEATTSSATTSSVTTSSATTTTASSGVTTTTATSSSEITTASADTTTPPDITTTIPDATTLPDATTTTLTTDTTAATSAVTTAPPKPGVKRGRIMSDDNGDISIFDALEILKYLVGIESKATDNPAALITDGARKTGKPTIFDALEILKHLVKMPSLVN